MSIADLLTYSRFVSALLLVPAALSRNQATYLAVLSWALLSDALDGPLARWLGTASVRGARLDSAADCAVYALAPITCWLAFPASRDLGTVDAVIIAVAFVVPIAYGFVKFRQLTSYHTRLARIAAGLLASGLLVLVSMNWPWLLHAAVLVFVISALEEMAITRRLERWHSPVSSLRDAERANASPSLLHVR